MRFRKQESSRSCARSYALAALVLLRATGGLVATATLHPGRPATINRRTGQVRLA